MAAKYSDKKVANMQIMQLVEKLRNIEIKSECALPTQIIDMGKNKDNVNNIFRYLLES